MSPDVSIVAVLKDEPQTRVDALLTTIAAQQGGPYEVVVALPADDRARLRLPPDVVVADNPTGRRSPGLNAAARAASGAVVCRVDARSVPPPDYARRTAARLADPAVGVVGGVQRPRAGAPGRVARGIARALGNPWALGGATYRRGGSGPVDTVYLGTYRRDELLRLGGFDERLDANEDFELCQRYRAAGLSVWLEDGVVVDYEARTTMAALARQYVAFGRSKVRFWRTTGKSPNRRQLAAVVGGAAAVATAVGMAVRRPSLLAPAAAIGVVMVASVDHVGAGPERDLLVRLAAWVAYVPIVGGWLAGVALEAIRRSPASAPRPRGPMPPSARPR